jgi:transcription antitermination factor NusG
MLKDDLLLDSARPFGDELNKENADFNAIGCPENTSAGVPLSWYALRVSYSRELKIQAQLQAKGVRTFVPMMWKKTDVAGQVEKKLVPAVNNLCFVYWTKSEIDEYIKGFGDKSPVHFYWDRTTSSPMVIPEKAMEDFIKVTSSVDAELIYITQIDSKLREGQNVRVKDGPFSGVEGKVVRIKKSRRILVELPGMLAVATTYVSPTMLEIL